MAALLSCFLLTGTAAGTDSKEEAREIIGRYYKATRLDRFADSLSGSYYFERFHLQGTAVVETKVYVTYPDKFRIEASQHDGKLVMVTDGERGWIKTPGEPTKELEPEMVRVIPSLYDIFDMLMLRDTVLSFKLDGRHRDGDRELWKVEVTDNTPESTAPVSHFYFDRNTGMLDRAETEVNSGERKVATGMTFRNYEKFNDFTLPTEIIMYMEGATQIVINTIEVKTIEHPSEKLFTRPE